MAQLFNQIIGKHEFKITKTDEEKQYVFGWAQVAANEDGSEIQDWQEDIVSPEDLEQSAYDYVLNFRDTGEKHDPKMRKKGKLIESVVFTKEKMAAIGIPEGLIPYGWWVGFHIDDSKTWEKYKNGAYEMFSVEGLGERVPIKPDSIAKSFREVIQKYNHYHDARGRFTTSGGAGGAVGSAAKPVATPAQKPGKPSSVAGSEQKLPAAGGRSLDKPIERAAGRGHISQTEYFKGVKDEKGAVEVIRADLEKSSGQSITTRDAQKMYDSVYSYSGGAYKQIRAAQADPKHASAADKRAAESVEKFIELSPKWNGGEMYRGMNLSGENAAAMIKSLKPGNQVDMQGMSSWTSSKGNATDYTRGDGSKFIFVLPKTSHGTSLEHLSNFPGENEVLLSGKSNLKVKSVENKTETSNGRMKQRYKVTYVTLEEVS